MPINGVFMEKFTLKILLLIYVFVYRLLCWKILFLVFSSLKSRKTQIFMEAPLTEQTGPQNRRDCVWCVWGQSRRRSSLAGELGLTAAEAEILEFSRKRIRKYVL